MRFARPSECDAEARAGLVLGQCLFAAAWAVLMLCGLDSSLRLRRGRAEGLARWLGPIHPNGRRGQAASGGRGRTVCTRLTGEKWLAAALDSTVIKLHQHGAGRSRNVVGRLFNRPRRRRIAARCDKLDARFLAFTGSP